MYHFVHDENFFSWPPSPQLAMFIFPYVRTAYYNLWREFVSPYEINLNRQIQGLPPLDPLQNNNGNATAGINIRRNIGVEGEGGIVGFIRTLIDALDPDEEGHNQGQGAADERRADLDAVAPQGGGDNDDEFVLEVVLGDVPEEQNGPQVGGAQLQPDVEPEVEAQDEGGEAADNDQPAVNAEEQQAPPQGEAFVPPPVRADLGTILSNASNGIVSALVLPGLSFAMGEALRLLVLPRSWTEDLSQANPWLRFGPTRRAGLFQNQWGRSLVGGCLYVVLKDLVRVYAKNRKAVAMGQRRVKNVDRARR